MGNRAAVPHQLPIRQGLTVQGKRLLEERSLAFYLGDKNGPIAFEPSGHDFLSPSEHDAILADRLPDARLEIVERAGHNPHDERPAEVMAAVRRFLAAPRGVRTPATPVCRAAADARVGAAARG